MNELKELLDFPYYYHDIYWLDEFIEAQRKHRDDDKYQMIKIAERHAKATEAEARSEKSDGA